LGGAGGDNGDLFLGAEEDVEVLVVENGECGIQPGRRRRGEGGHGVRFCSVRG